MTREEALEHMRAHAKMAEEALEAATKDPRVMATVGATALCLSSAQAHATLAIYWQGEVRDMVL